MNVKPQDKSKSNASKSPQKDSSDNEITSQNDTSDLAAIVFNVNQKNLLSILGQKTDQNTPSNQKFPVQNPSIQPNSRQNIYQIPQNTKSILQNLPKNEQNQQSIPNSSLYSSGYLSFRNKKANILNPNLSNNSKIMEEQIDPEVIAQSILQKFNSIRNTNRNTSSTAHISNINNNINININNNINIHSDEGSNTDNKYFNMEKKEISRFLFHNNEPTKEEIDEINNKNNQKFAIDDMEENSEGNKRNIFLDLGNDNKNLLGNIEEKNQNDENVDDCFNYEYENKEKVINKIICTLSIIDKGRAVFVSEDDIIFILPSMFIPKSIKVGSTYMFVISERDDYLSKVNEIRDIQEKIVKDGN